MTTISTIVRSVRPRTFYDILEISRLSKSDEIRSAYLKLAKQYHPDSATEISEISETRFREVQEAYSTLSSPWKRTLYDQDLQFQSAVAMTGSSASGVANWRENFNQESAEARIARRQRYERYAKGERNDLPPVQLTTKASLIGLVLCGSALTWVCAKAPEWFGGQGELTFHDPVSDDRSVPLVRAFFNPIMRKWERLAEGQDVPSFPELLAQYKRLSPQLMERWEYAQKIQENDIEAIQTLTVTQVPKTKTAPASVFKDENGHIQVNRRTINDALSKFIDRISDYMYWGLS